MSKNIKYGKLVYYNETCLQGTSIHSKCTYIAGQNISDIQEYKKGYINGVLCENYMVKT